MHFNLFKFDRGLESNPDYEALEKWLNHTVILI